MTERLRAMDVEELGAALSSLDLEWPPVPEIAPAVMAAVRSGRPARVVSLPRSRRTRVLLIAAATVLLLAGAAVAAKLVIDLGAVVVRTPDGGLGVPPTSSPVPLGEPITLAAASDLFGDEVSYPARLGRPDRVWADEVLTEEGMAVRVTLAWDPGPALPTIDGTSFGAVLMRFEADIEVASKDVSEGTGTVEPARVGEAHGVWTSGPHTLQLLTSEGVVYVRVEGNVLLWRDGRSTLRLETSVPRSVAIRIAESLPGTR